MANLHHGHGVADPPLSEAWVSTVPRPAGTSAEHPRPPSEPSRRRLPPFALTATAAGLLALAGVAAAARGALPSLPPLPPPVAGTGEPPPALPETPTSPPPSLELDTLDSAVYEVPSWVEPAIWTVVGVVAALVVWFLVRRLWALRPKGGWYEGERPDTAGEVIEGAEAPIDLTDPLTQARAALTSEARPRDAVVAAWVALEHGAAEHGAARDAAQTPTEFTEAMLRATLADPDAVTRLRRVYLRARFSLEPLRAEDVTTAASALDRIEETWR